MDYAFVSSLKHDIQHGIQEMMVSYDIGCQWSTNLDVRLPLYGDSIPDGTQQLPKRRVGVPKAHLPGHGKGCQTVYNLNYMVGVGRTFGEGVEQGWAHIGPVASATRESGPSARHALLDDHWSAWNWKKLVRLGKRFTHLTLKQTQLDEQGRRSSRTFAMRRNGPQFNVVLLMPSPLRSLTM